jgi:redox-sensitive bicupin YhaK (pirin superfamily)
MITVRPAAERGHTLLDWLDSRHSFSFGEYRDPRHMGFSTLRVINEDIVKPGGGFATHGHRDMEIITWILSGALEHRDSLGTGSVIRPGDAQRMSAGTGIRHSEFNHSATDPVHFLQIWILPARDGIAPGYEQKAIAIRDGALTLAASGDGRAGSITIHQDTDLYAGRLSPRDAVEHSLRAGRSAWLQVARGQIMLNDQALEPGDGAAISDERALEIRGRTPSEVLLFDMP